MAFNKSIEAPNFDKINSEAGQFTSDAVSLLWAALNDTRAEMRRLTRRSKEQLEPKVLRLNAAASVNNLDLAGASVVEFIGTTAQNFTGMRAPETNESRLVIVYVTGTGTITVKHNVTSETPNRLFNESGADVALATGAGTMFIYLAGSWRELS